MSSKPLHHSQHAALQRLAKYGAEGCTYPQLIEGLEITTHMINGLLKRGLAIGLRIESQPDLKRWRCSISVAGQTYLEKKPRAAVEQRRAKRSQSYGASLFYQRDTYKPPPTAINRPGQEDALKHPSLIGSERSWLNPATGQWQNRPPRPPGKPLRGPLMVTVQPTP